MSTVSVEVHGSWSARRKHGIKVAPMAPLSAVVAAALSAEGVSAEPSACRLFHGKTQLDLKTPLRFANLPAGAKLQLLTGQERQTGWGSFTAATSAEAPTVPRTQKAASNAGAPTAVRQPSDSGTAATSAVGLSADAASLAPHQLQEQEETANVPSLMDLDGADARSHNFVGRGSATRENFARNSMGGSGSNKRDRTPAANTQQAADTSGASSAAGNSSGAGGGVVGEHGQARGQDVAADPTAAASGVATDMSGSDGGFRNERHQARGVDHQAQQAHQTQHAQQSQQGQQAQQTQHAQDSQQGKQAQQSELSRLLGREAFVFTRQAALEAAAAASGTGRGEEPSDEFFDFTAADYARVSRGWGMNTVKAETSSGPLMTAKLRKAAAESAAARAAPIPIRVAFPDGMLLQGRFAAGETVADLSAFTSAAVVPGGDLLLYVTPPKSVLKDASQTLLAAGLSPAAIVYVVGTPGQAAPQLASHVMALQSLLPAASAFSGSGRGDITSDRSGAQLAAAQAAAGSAASGSQPQQRSAASGAKLPRWLKTGK